MSLGQHSGDAGENPSLQRSSSEAETLDLIIAGLSNLDADQLRLKWRNHLGGTAPAHLPRWLLLRVLAYRLQAAALGDHEKAAVRSIRASRGAAIDFADAPFKKRRPRTREGIGLNPGALLVREWKGKLERVMVLDKGFAWNGRTFGSLSQVAKAITGTSWNGHRFFGLRSVKDRSSKKGVARSNADENGESEAARSDDLRRRETNDQGREETERAVANAKRSGAHLTRRRVSNPETKPHDSVKGRPRQGRMETCP
jgi:hypothetical protein